MLTPLPGIISDSITGLLWAFKDGGIILCELTPYLGMAKPRKAIDIILGDPGLRA